MVSRCTNPTYQTEFRTLTTGDLYAFEKRSANTEFFWLCSTCAPLVALFLDLTGRVVVGRRFMTELRQQPNPNSYLRLDYSHLEHKPWLRTSVERELTLTSDLPSSSQEAA
jgi:hypothetical protein